MRAVDPTLPALSPADEAAFAAAGIVADEARPGRWRETRGAGERGLTTTEARRRARNDLDDPTAGLTGDDLARHLGGPDAVALPSRERVDAHLDAGGHWLVAYRGGGALRAYRGVPSQREAVHELAATGATLAWLAVDAGTP